MNVKTLQKIHVYGFSDWKKVSLTCIFLSLTRIFKITPNNVKEPIKKFYALQAEKVFTTAGCGLFFKNCDTVGLTIRKKASMVTR